MASKAKPKSKKRARRAHEHAGLNPAKHVKVHVEEFARESALGAGHTFKKALKVVVPKQVLDNSSFFGGLNRLGDAVINAGTPSKEAQDKSKQYVVRHSGGAIADLTIGVALFGMPVTLITALFSDGCKVVSTVLKDAGREDEEAAQVGEFFGDMSVVSNNFMKLFDIPSKESAEEVHDSIEAMTEQLNKEGRLSAKLKKELKELDELRVCALDDKSEWCRQVQEKLSKIAKDELSESKIKSDVKDVKKFIEQPTIAHIKGMKDTLIRDFSTKERPLAENTIAFIEDLVKSLENFSSDEFQNDIREFIIKQFELADKTQDVIEGAAYRGYKIIHSLLNTTYKGAFVFGRHYKKQIECAVDKDKCEPG